MIEKIIISNLISNEEYTRKVLPHLDDKFFHDKTERIVFRLIEHFVKTYNKLPNKTILHLDADKIPGLQEDEFKQLNTYIDGIEENKTDLDWLVAETEKFCQDKAIYNAIMDSIKIIDGKDPKRHKSVIPQLLTQALSITFNSHIGHDYLEDWEHRYEFYHNNETRIPFNLEYFNKITRGGIPRKSLTIILAGTGVGKTMFMCHCAAHNLTMGQNVLYITLEMSEERIGERIDANLLNVNVEELEMLPKDAYEKKVQRVKSKTQGRLVIHEYPTVSAGAANFRYLLDELKTKKNFVPDIIYVDYLNICVSSRIKMGSSMNSYMYVKAIAEEVRGLAVEFNVPVITGTQINREGFASSDFGMENVSESFGLPMTADFMFALISTEELSDLNQIMVKQLKNRYSDPGKLRRFMIGVDKGKMKFYDVEQDAQKDVEKDHPAFDQTPTGLRFKDELYQ